MLGPLAAIGSLSCWPTGVTGEAELELRFAAGPVDGSTGVEDWD